MNKTATAPSWSHELAIQPGEHVIAIVNSGSDVDLLAPYFESALERGDPCVTVASPPIVDEVVESLHKSDVNRESVLFHNPGELGWKDGRFDADQFLKRAGEKLGELMEQGAERVRHSGIMRWLNDVDASEEECIYLEARINQVIEGSCMCGFCVYDSRYIGGHLLVQLLRTHPKVLMDGEVVVNPFYVPPEKVIEELGR